MNEIYSTSCTSAIPPIQIHDDDDPIAELSACRPAGSSHLIMKYRDTLWMIHLSRIKGHFKAVIATKHFSKMLPVSRTKNRFDDKDNQRVDEK